MSNPIQFPPLNLIVDDLACARGGVPVFEGVSFDLQNGEALALTGANGSGKSSLLRTLSGLMKPAAGTIALEGEDTSTDLLTVSHFLGHTLALEESRSVRANLRFHTTLLGARVDADQALSSVGLGLFLDAPVQQLSAGERKRLALARLIAARRPLWLLDEATAALDKDGAAVLGGLASAHLAAGGMIIAATHGALPFATKAELALTSNRESTA